MDSSSSIVRHAADTQPMAEEEADHITLRISLKLDTLADAHESVMPLIREAIERRAYVALGYPSLSAYVADRFDDSLSRLGVDMRREVVKELSAAGISTRAIAPVVGVAKSTVERDQQAAVPQGTPDPEFRLAKVTGLDGKAYPRPEKKRHRLPLPEQILRRTWELGTAVKKIERLAADDRIAKNRDRYTGYAYEIRRCRDQLDRVLEKMSDERRDH
jgi:transposase